MQASSCTCTQFNMDNSKSFEPNNRIIGGSNTLSNANHTVVTERGKLQQLESDSIINCVFTWARTNRYILKSGRSVDLISPKRASNRRYGPTRSIVHRRKLLRHNHSSNTGCVNSTRTSR